MDEGPGLPYFIIKNFIILEMADLFSSHLILETLAI